MLVGSIVHNQINKVGLNGNVVSINELEPNNLE